MKTKTMTLLLAGPLSLCSLALAAPTPWPAPVQALQQQGYEILGSFAGPAGMTGYAALFLSKPQTIYLTPDGRQAIVGAMLDANGERWNQAGLDQQFSRALWQQLQASAWLADGPADATRVIYTFTDPNCGYCHQLWQQARPWVQAGKVQFRHILVGILQDDSPAKAAAILSAANPAAALQQHEQGYGQGGVTALVSIPAAAQRQLDANHQLMERFGAYATPASFYLDEAGLVQKVQGAPSADALRRILGPR